jgi:AcrR family transcriptional regulator
MREAVLDAAIRLLDEGGANGLTMRALASSLNVTPMSLYHHVGDRAGLLRALAERVYGEVLLDASAASPDPLVQIKTLLLRYHAAVSRHPQLTLEIFSEADAFAGVVKLITDRLTMLLDRVTAEPILWRDILVDHAHGSGLALISAWGNQERAVLLQEQYQLALERLLAGLAAEEK